MVCYARGCELEYPDWPSGIVGRVLATVIAISFLPIGCAVRARTSRRVGRGADGRRTARTCARGRDRQWHGVAAEEEWICHCCGTATIGITEMLRCARKLGLRARSYTIDWRQLADTALPGIVALRDGGFLVLAMVVENHVLVHHPLASQAQVITRAEFESLWDGRFVTMRGRASLPALSHRLFRVFVAFALIAAASLLSSLSWRLTANPSSSPPADPHRFDQVAVRSPAIPVVAATVERQDVPIYLSGLGTVQAFNTVRVTSRVDGQLRRLSFQEGQDVRAGDILAEIDPLTFQAALRQVEANLRRDQAQLRSAKADLDRTLALATHDFASRQNVDMRRSSVEQLEAAIEADQAQIDNAKIQLQYTVIRSPMDGRAGLRLIDEGNTIRASDPTGIVVLMQLQPIEVIFALSEEDLPKINNRLSADGPPAVAAFGRDGQTVLAEGVLATVDNVIDRKTGTFKLKAHFRNDRKSLWPGQFVNARIHLATRQGGVVVSEAAVQRGPEGPYVFVIDPDNTVAMKPIKVAQTDAGTALIDEGLNPGERVVIDGQYRLQQGSRVVEVKPN